VNSRKKELESLVNIEDPADLLTYLRNRGVISRDEKLETRRLVGGVSNRTVMVSRQSGETWVFKQGLPKLRVKTDWFCSPERVYREAAGLRLLSRITPSGSIPELVFEDRKNLLLAMRAVPEPHENWKQMLLSGNLIGNHITQFSTLLATIHRESAKEVERLEAEFGDQSFFEALRLEPYYAYTAQQVPSVARFYDALLKETRGHRVTIVHGDYSPKNILVHRDRLILLDHEVIHWGDPAFDLGFSLTHLLSKANHLGDRRHAFFEAAGDYWKTYWGQVSSEGWIEEIEARVVRHTLGCLLARVAGRSPLEYLSPAECSRQKETVVSMLDNPPKTVGQLIREFARRIADLCLKSKT